MCIYIVNAKQALEKHWFCVLASYNGRYKFEMQQKCSMPRQVQHTKYAMSHTKYTPNSNLPLISHQIES
jgi:hypothetical protein